MTTLSNIIFENGDIIAKLYSVVDNKHIFLNIDKIINDCEIKDKLSRLDLEKIYQLSSVLEQRKFIHDRNKLKSNNLTKLYVVK